jgi:hypothetical protein
MKKIKVSILALSVLVGGAVFASAAKNNNLTVASTEDITLTNVVPLVYSDVSTLPTSAFLVLTQGTSFQAAVVNTDSGGKISGVANVVKKYFDASGTNVIGASSFYVTVKGKISASQMGVPTVQMTLKGNGYTAPGVSNTVVIYGVEHKDSFPGSLSLNFKANKTAVVNLSTNFGQVTGHIIGTLSGTFKPGLAAINSKTVKINEPGDLQVDFNRLGELDMRVIVFGNKFAAVLYQTDASGQGNISKNNTYTLNLKSAAGGNSSLQLKGQIGAWAFGSTNNTITTINTADVKGKIEGQAVASTGYHIQ